ncbi:hypothetical protein L9F63_026782, partial [Diploptera punctata]
SLIFMIYFSQRSRSDKIGNSTNLLTPVFSQTSFSTNNPYEQDDLYFWSGHLTSIL